MQNEAPLNGASSRNSNAERFLAMAMGSRLCMTPPCRDLRVRVLYECSRRFPARIGDVVHHQPRATSQGRRGHCGTRQDLQVKMGMVGVTALRGDLDRAVTGVPPTTSVDDADQRTST